MSRKYQKHGMSHTKIYNVWQSMRKRVYGSAHNSHLYTAKSITICKEWDNFLCFYEWSLANGHREGLEIDRIDNYGNYCPENCRWTTHLINSQNRDMCLTPQNVIDIRQLVASGNVNKTAIAKTFNVNRRQIYRIINGDAWANITG